MILKLGLYLAAQKAASLGFLFAIFYFLVILFPCIGFTHGSLAGRLFRPAFSSVDVGMQSASGCSRWEATAPGIVRWLR